MLSALGLCGTCLAFLQTLIVSNALPAFTTIEGDILVSTEFQSSGVKNLGRRWPEATVVYTIDSSFSDSERGVIFGAMEEMRNRSCMQFRERTIEPGFLQIIRTGGGGCTSQVGYTGRPQSLYLEAKSEKSPGCIEHKTVLHELLHTLGFYHEHARPDRDQYVTIDLDNVAKEDRHNFEKRKSAEVTDFGLPYDYESLLHYPLNAFAQNSSRPTIIVKDKYVRVGFRPQMSVIDVNKIRRMYSDIPCYLETPSLANWRGHHMGTFGRHTYTYVYDPQIHWDAAVEQCANAGLVLSSVQSPEELQFIQSFMTRPNGGVFVAAMWIGGRKKGGSGSEFTWIENGKPVPSFIWAPGEPNDRDGRETSMNVWARGANDEAGNTNRAFICRTKEVETLLQ